MSSEESSHIHNFQLPFLLNLTEDSEGDSREGEGEEEEEGGGGCDKERSDREEEEDEVPEHTFFNLLLAKLLSLNTAHSRAVR